MKRTTCTLLMVCLFLMSFPAHALTGEEALGLVDVSASGDSSDASYPTLQIGSQDGDDAGAYVVILQNRLIELGYLSSAADGTFGSQTESAIINFQESNGLTPTGIADSATQELLYSQSAQRNTVQGAADNETLRVQQMLTRWGFMTGMADGIWGDATKTGISEFMDYISGNSIYAPYTNSTPEPVATQAPEDQPVALDVPIESTNGSGSQAEEIPDQVLKFIDGEYIFEVYQTTLQSGDSGDEVWRVQRRLKQLNYLYKPDGNYGSLTELALKAFQKSCGLSETGIADEATQRKLFSAEAIQADEYVFPYKIYVSIDEQRVYIYGWDGSAYTTEIGSCECSTGQSGYDTPKGTYQSGGKCNSGPWYYFENYNVYAKYATRIVGGVLFHSVLYNANKQGPTQSSVNSLGSKASHGCVRLAEENAQWIFENCPEGTTIVIY